MKILFLVPKHFNSHHLKLYTAIVDALVKSGHTVTHTLNVPNTDWNELQCSEYFAQFYAKMGRCDLVIAECSLPSMQIGYEISCALQLGKEVIILKSQNNKSHTQPMDPIYMHKNIFTYEYGKGNLLNTLKTALNLFQTDTFA